MQKLSPEFFARPVLEVAPDLLGKFLVRRNAAGEETALMITEVEAYDGPEDLACHACKGRTARTEPLFGEPGHFYVYLCYGIHWMLNVVTNEREYPAAVLIRGIEGFDGPGKLTRFMQIDKGLNGKPAVPESGLWIEDRGLLSAVAPDRTIARGPRIGVDYAGPVWAKKPYRFLLRSARATPAGK